MKVGDYVRTKYGEICKLKKSRFKDLVYETDIEIDRHNDRDCNDYGFDSNTIQDIIKSSPNIIDLIEYGDIVKYKIDDELFIAEVWGEENDYFIQHYDFNIDIKDLDIKSVITHEQIEDIEYKVKE